MDGTRFKVVYPVVFSSPRTGQGGSGLRFPYPETRDILGSDLMAILQTISVSELGIFNPEVKNLTKIQATEMSPAETPEYQKYKIFATTTNLSVLYKFMKVVTYLFVVNITSWKFRFQHSGVSASLAERSDIIYYRLLCLRSSWEGRRRR